MLRKRTAFKPNLKQVAPPKTTDQQQEPAAQPAGAVTGPTESCPIQSDIASNPAAAAATTPTSQSSTNLTTASTNNSGDKQNEVSEQIPETNNQRNGTDHGEQARERVSPTKRQIDDESNKRVHEAITQLTGQKFEPIKSISLRNSANKNVKLKDLLFFNPPLTKDQKRHKKSIHQAKKDERKRLADDQQKSKANDDNNDDVDEEIDINDSNRMDDELEEPSIVPKVKLGPDGKLILDESSTIINRKNSIKAQEAIVEDNEEIISRTNYDSYRRKPTSTSQTKWSLDDTQKFYHALTILGTDFSMMESLLFSGHRSRTELHKKFKREERINKAKIDIALSNRISLNSEELDGLKDMFYK